MVKARTSRGGSDRGGGKGGGGAWSGLETLTVEPTGLADGLDMGHEKPKEEVMDACTASGGRGGCRLLRWGRLWEGQARVYPGTGSVAVGVPSPSL